jgi:hypothetical protein
MGRTLYRKEKTFPRLALFTCWMKENLETYPHIGINQVATSFAEHDDIKFPQVF